MNSRPADGMNRAYQQGHQEHQVTRAAQVKKMLGGFLGALGAFVVRPGFLR
jgi:hypothetical protein